MIIKSSRLPSRIGAKTTAQHVLRGPANEEITLLRGAEQDLHDWVRDARKRKKEFAVRHWKLSPEADITAEQETETLLALAAEFEFDPERVVFIRHKKPRHDNQASEFHLHLLVPEVNPLTGKVLSTRWDYARHEKVSRKLEAAWGHDIVPGRFNAPVLNALRAEGNGEVADYLRAEGLQPDARAESAWPDGLHNELGRRAKRSMPEVERDVRDAWTLACGDVAAFQDILSESGLRAVPGDKASRWVVEARGPDGSWAFAGALHRLVRVKSNEVNNFMRAEVDAPGLGRKNDGRRHEGQALEHSRLLGDAGGDGGPSNAANSRRARYDACVRRIAARSREGQLADGVARYGGGPRGRVIAGPHREAARRNGGTAEGHERKAERAHPVVQQPREPRSGVERSQAVGGRDGAATEATRSEADRARRLRRLIDVAAVQARFGMPDGLQQIDVWRTQVRGPLRPVQGATNRTIRVAEPEPDLRLRRERFRLLVLRRAYKLEYWLPPEAILNVRRIDWDDTGARLLLTLWSGTQLLDTGDRITVRGTVDDVAVSELVACVTRRGWSVVQVSGDAEFRVAASRELLRMGIEVEDCPLPLDEQDRLRSLPATVGMQPPQFAGGGMGA